MHRKSTASYLPTKPAAICLIELCTTASSVSSETSAHRPRASTICVTPSPLPLSRSGNDIKTVQENLGHATAAFTLDVYGHFTDDMRSVSAQRMEGFITNVLNL